MTANSIAGGVCLAAVVSSIYIASLIGIVTLVSIVLVSTPFSISSCKVTSSNACRLMNELKSAELALTVVDRSTVKVMLCHRVEPGASGGGGGGEVGGCDRVR